MGHCDAAPHQIEAIKHYGLKIMTHCLNATDLPPARIGTRSVGPDEYCLADEEMFAELICDSGGIHVPVIWQKILLKMKGIDKIILISDSFVSDTNDHPDCFKYPDLSFDHNGLLSGSKLTLDIACRNFIKHTGVSLPMAFKAASLNPAKAVGLDQNYGSIAEGKIANLIFCDAQIGIQKIMLYGKEI
jgi:N-acetylglucosamine-6-phosphate deacetylase